MKRVLLSALLILIFSTVVFAEWQVDFEDTYLDKGIDQAVVDALEEGIEPDSIVQIGLNLEGLNPQNLIMALYCAGAKGSEIRAAADVYQVPEMIVTAGFKKSVEECSDAIADSQAYTPTTTSSPGGRSAGGGSATFASRSTF